MSMQTKGHSKVLFMPHFLRIKSKLKNFNENRSDKSSNNHLSFVYRIECTFHLSFINKVCEYSPSQQHFLIVSHKPNNKGIVLVCP